MSWGLAQCKTLCCLSPWINSMGASSRHCVDPYKMLWGGYAHRVRPSVIRTPRQPSSKHTHPSCPCFASRRPSHGYFLTWFAWPLHSCGWRDCKSWMINWSLVIVVSIETWACVACHACLAIWVHKFKRGNIALDAMLKCDPAPKTMVCVWTPTEVRRWRGNKTRMPRILSSPFWSLVCLPVWWRFGINSTWRSIGFNINCLIASVSAKTKRISYVAYRHVWIRWRITSHKTLPPWCPRHINVVRMMIALDALLLVWSSAHHLVCWKMN